MTDNKKCFSLGSEIMDTLNIIDENMNNEESFDFASKGINNINETIKKNLELICLEDDIIKEFELVKEKIDNTNPKEKKIFDGFNMWMTDIKRKLKNQY